MIGGITLLGVVTASIASWHINRVRDVETTTDDHINRRLDELHHEITELQAMITTPASHGPTPERPGS